MAVRRLRDVFSRLRAALTPQAILLLAVLFLFAGLALRDSDETAFERRVAQTLSSVEGAGRVQVAIRMKEQAATGSVLSGAQKNSIPGGAVAVAQGADDPLVALELHQALCALLSLPPSAVSIMTGGK